MDKKISIETANYLFDLDKENGNLIWKNPTSNRVKRGSIAGCHHKASNSIVIGLYGKLFYAHRIIYLIYNGKWPDYEIDHIDGNRINNKPSNLREATRSQNQTNLGITKRNKSGIRGVWWDKNRKKWASQIQKNHKVKSLGRFDTIEEAYQAYKNASIEIHGEFRRL